MGQGIPFAILLAIFPNILPSINGHFGAMLDICGPKSGPGAGQVSAIADGTKFNIDKINKPIIIYFLTGTHLLSNFNNVLVVFK